MQDKKTKLSFEKEKGVEIEYGGNTVVVTPYLSIGNQEILKQVYLDEYFKEGTSSVINAEHSLLAVLLELCTNIQMTEEVDGKVLPVLHVDDLLLNFDLIKKIRNAIQNYNEFRALLRQTVDKEAERLVAENSIGKQISLMAEGITNAINTISNFDASDESIERIRSLVKEVEASPIIKQAVDIFKEGKTEEKET